MHDAFRITPSFRKNLPTYLCGGLLLIISFYGFWLAHAQGDNFSYLLCFGFAPLAVFMVLAVRAVVGEGKASPLGGYMDRIDQLQKRLNAQDDFIRSITDYAPTAMIIFNTNNEYWFVNSSAAASLGHDSTAIIGKTPVALLGGEAGRKIERNLDQVRQSNAPLDLLTQRVDAKGAIRYMQMHYEPMSAVGDFAGGIILREEDITKILAERERSENMLRQVISTLVGVVDRRDPYASGHSSRVGLLARRIAVEMQLSEREIETAEVAGSLMNFGKVLVSRSILTKTTVLTPSELQRIRDGIMTSADILSLIDFGIPVVPTLRQVLERVDGTGVPNRYKGDDILMTARIVAVANAFIALVSPRAYRPGVDPLVAADRLAQESGTVFDERVIATLRGYLRKNVANLGWLTTAKSS